MTLHSVGEISEIKRFPVKSFAGEALQASHIVKSGLDGDRCFAFIDETKEGWDSFITARDIPNMLAYKAKIIGEDHEGELPELVVTSPDGRIFNWSEELLDEIQRYSKRKMSMKCYKPQNADLMAVDSGSILIITDTTLRKLEEIWGKRLDKRRFRANLVVTLDENSSNEGNWIGKRIRIGSSELQIDSYCERCSMTTIDPDTLERDVSLLKKINEEMNLNFGVYASVIKTGPIHVGEKVYLVD